MSCFRFLGLVASCISKAWQEYKDKKEKKKFLKAESKKAPKKPTTQEEQD